MSIMAVHVLAVNVLAVNVSLPPQLIQIRYRTVSTALGVGFEIIRWYGAISLEMC